MTEETVPTPVEEPVPPVPPPPPPLTAAQQDEKFVEMNMKLIELFDGLTVAQKVHMLVKYVERFGALPSPPPPPPEPAYTEQPAETQGA